MDLEGLAGMFEQGFEDGALITFGIAIDDEASPGLFGIAGIRWDEVASWTIEGLAQDTLVGPSGEGAFDSLTYRLAGVAGRAT